MSEKRDLWVPLVLVLAGGALLAANAAEGRVGLGLLALVVAWVGAVACLPIRLKKGQARNITFGFGVSLLLVPLIPGVVERPADGLAWVVAGLAFVLPAPPLPQKVRAAFLGAGGVLGVMGLLALAGVLPQGLTWLLLAGAFHLALQVVNARPRREPEAPPGPRVGILGGSFDPFHAGHRALAEAALRVVDRLLVVPAGRAPHKPDAADRTAFHHRVAMARLGVEGLARTEVLEMDLPGVITMTKGKFEPRYASLKGIMAAKRKPLDQKEAQGGESRLAVRNLAYPPERPAGRIVGEGAEAAGELVRLLREEAKAL